MHFLWVFLWCLKISEQAFFPRVQSINALMIMCLISNCPVFQKRSLCSVSPRSWTIDLFTLKKIYFSKWCLINMLSVCHYIEEIGVITILFQQQQFLPTKIYHQLFCDITYCISISFHNDGVNVFWRVILHTQIHENLQTKTLTPPIKCIKI